MEAEGLRASDPDEVNGAAMMAGAVVVMNDYANEVGESVDAVGAGSGLKIAVEGGEHGESVEDAAGLCAEAAVDAGAHDGEQDVESGNGHWVHDDGAGENDGDGRSDGVWTVAVRVACRVVGLYLCRVQDTLCPCSSALVHAPIRVLDPGRAERDPCPSVRVRGRGHLGLRDPLFRRCASEQRVRPAEWSCPEEVGLYSRLAGRCDSHLWGARPDRMVGGTLGGNKDSYKRPVHASFCRDCADTSHFPRRRGRVLCSALASGAPGHAAEHRVP